MVGYYSILKKKGILLKLLGRSIFCLKCTFTEELSEHCEDSFTAQLHDL